MSAPADPNHAAVLEAYDSINKLTNALADRLAMLARTEHAATGDSRNAEAARFLLQETIRQANAIAIAANRLAEATA